MSTKPNKGKETHKSKSQLKRDAYPYRTEYFKRSPGLFGCIWFCSQCGRVLVGKSNVVVDHIVPLAGRGINRSFNTVAACQKCNSKKSDKGGIFIVKGAFAKIIERLLFTVQKIVVLAFVGAFSILTFPLRLLLKLIIKLLVAGGIVVKAGAIVAIVLLVRYFTM